MSSHATRPIVASIARPVLVDRAVYGTITIVCVLIIYDGWATLRIRDAIAIIVGPILAMFISHVFSASVAQHVVLGRNRTGEEWFRTVKFESRFLLLAAPPVALLIILDLAGLSLSDAILVVIWVEALSIGFWAGAAAVRGGFGARGVALSVVAGLLVGALVLLLQVFLQPGKAHQGGVADGRAAPPRPFWEAKQSEGSVRRRRASSTLMEWAICSSPPRSSSGWF